MINQSISIIDSLGQTLGISSDILWIACSLSSIFAISLFVYKSTMNVFFSSIVSTIGIIAISIIGIIPIWVMFIFIFMSCLLFYEWICRDSSFVVESYCSYGDKLKLAYEAKFGYRNSEFDKEVDAHIKAVESLRKGLTRSVHMDKLIRLEKFVEAKKGSKHKTEAVILDSPIKLEEKKVLNDVSNKGDRYKDWGK